MSYPKYEKYRTRSKDERTLYEKTVDLLQSMKRVLKVANKPDWDIYKRTMLIVMVGILLLGGISYVIQLILTVVPLGA
ncbi:MAG: protein translocase SEC61 complex subunit gamma [Promethearchaeota archaeon]|nr:MAG: protein translocase SEC61 complex subunit gamma [Candidatus Lokiarchaeota archaeon]